MASAALYAMTAALVLGVTLARLERAFALTVLSLFLIPSFLLLPMEGISSGRIPRIVMLAFAVSLVRRTHRGEIDATSLRVPRLVLAVVLGAAVLGVAGVGLAGAQLTLSISGQTWLIFVDQAVMLFATVVTTRNIGARKAADIVLVAFGIALLAGVWEHWSGRSWSSLFPTSEGQHIALQYPLEQRGGARVRGGALFALEYGWFVAILLPLALQRLAAPITSRWRWLLLAMPVGSLAVVLWTRSRSALVAAAAGGVLLVVFARLGRRAALPVLVGGVVAGSMLLVSDIFEDVFEVDRPIGATEQDVRIDRLPGILEEVSTDSITGLGFGGLADAGYITPDNGWLLLYAESGVVGVATFGALALLAVATCARALRGPPSPLRDLGAAVVAGVVLWLVANVAYDAVNLGLSAALFWLLAGIGTVIGERVTVAPSRLPPGAVMSGAACLMVVAVAAAVVAPTHVTRKYQFQNLPTSVASNPAWTGDRPARITSATVCDAMRAVDVDEPAGSIECVDPGSYEPGSGDYSVASFDTGRMSATAASRVQLDRLEQRIRAAGDELVHFQLRRLSPDLRGSPTPLRTAPIWAAIALSFLVTFWPRRRALAAARGAHRQP